VKKNAKFSKLSKSVTFLYIFPFRNWRECFCRFGRNVTVSEIVVVDIEGLPALNVRILEDLCPDLLKKPYFRAAGVEIILPLPGATMSIGFPVPADTKEPEMATAGS